MRIVLRWFFPTLFILWFPISCQTATETNGPDPYVTNRFVDNHTVWLSGTAEIYLPMDSPRKSVVVYQTQGRAAARLAMQESFFEICRTEQERSEAIDVIESKYVKDENRRSLKLKIVKEILDSPHLNYRYSNESDSFYPLFCIVSGYFSKEGIKNFCLYNTYLSEQRRISLPN